MFDGSLSLLLCLIPNVMTIYLDLTATHPLPTTLVVLGALEFHASEGTDPEVPFGKLERLFLSSHAESGCRYPVTISPGLQRLSVRGSSALELYGHGGPTRKGHDSLRVLEFQSADFHSQILENAISSSALANLRTLAVEGIGRGNIHSDGNYPRLQYNYRGLKGGNG
jgi:hypothetical protein